MNLLDAAKVRTWTDRSGSFKVEAEFILIKDGKIHLHKVNGVKIAVPVTKMSVEDLEYVERVTGESLDDDKPLSDLKRRSMQQPRAKDSGPTGISVERKPEYDWFDFFLKCGVNPQICERYARAFTKDEMTEENIPDITPGLLRTLGLKEGDILRVTKHLDAQFGRDKRNAEDGGEGASGGLFSGPGGALRNNTRKGRPAPPVETNDVVDPKAFESKSDDTVKKPADGTPTPLASAPTPDKTANGFDDNAWDVKPSKSASTPAPAASPPAAQAPVAKPPQLTGSMNDLSLLDMPALKPDEIAQPTPPAPAPQPTQAPVQQPPAPAQQPQPTGATPTLFEQVAAIKALTQPQNMAPPRMRPQAPQQQNTGGLIAPPPQRSSSAPMNPQQSAFGPPPPLQPQLTGYNPNMMGQNSGQGMPPMQQQMTGFPQQNGGFGFQQNGMMPQPTGYNSMSPPQQQPMQTGFAQYQQQQPTGFQQPMQTGFQQQPHFTQGFGNGSPFADPPRAPFQPLQAQPTGYNSFQPSPLNPQATGVNRFLPPALAPQPTGYQSTPPLPPMPPMPSMPTAQPLVPQKTGPPPSIKFGVQPAKKLTPQPTGRANLANASKSLKLFCVITF